MSEPSRQPQLILQLTVEELREIVTDAVRAAMRSAPREDRLLSVEQVCEILNCDRSWLYHKARALPFTRKVGGKLRFSSLELQRYIERSKLQSV